MGRSSFIGTRKDYAWLAAVQILTELNETMLERILVRMQWAGKTDLCYSFYGDCVWPSQCSLHCFEKLRILIYILVKSSWFMFKSLSYFFWGALDNGGLPAKSGSHNTRMLFFARWFGVLGVKSTIEEWNHSYWTAEYSLRSRSPFSALLCSFSLLMRALPNSAEIVRS